MAIDNALASVAGKDINKAANWYEKVHGRPADFTSCPRTNQVLLEIASMDPPKNQSGPPASPWQGEALEFELTDFAEARRVLDTESLSQFEAATVSSPAQWKRLRRANLPTDRALSGQAIDWLMSLPPSLRPEKISAQFPRIANALAEIWHEPTECQAALDKLLGDGRKGRSGFPPKVHDELIALRDRTQVF